jgi:ribonucleoside-triphosphate reductase
MLLEAYFLHRPAPVFDYSMIRPAGVPIKGFGGVSSGPESLRLLHDHIRATLDPLVGRSMTVYIYIYIYKVVRLPRHA